MDSNELATGWKVTAIFHCTENSFTYDKSFATREDALEYISDFLYHIQPPDDLDCTIFLYKPDGTCDLSLQKLDGAIGKVQANIT